MSANGQKPTIADEAPHLLLVDDDTRIRSLLSRFLAEKGYRVTSAASAKEASARLAGLSFDLLILDVMMPGESGLDLTRAVRRHSHVPILMLTALGDTKDRISGLETGADDYMAKPFDPQELLLRIASLLRRSQPVAAPGEDARFGAFTFHAARGELRRGDEAIRLTERERELLKILVAQRGGAVSRLDLAGSEASGERAVDVQINRLRRKIEEDPANPLLLQTVRGSGYRLLVE